MTSKDLSIFNSLKPFSIGFDDMFDQFESMLGNGGLVQNNYPPYNIRKAGKDKYAIELAVADAKGKEGDAGLELLNTLQGTLQEEADEVPQEEEMEDEMEVSEMAEPQGLMARGAQNMGFDWRAFAEGFATTAAANITEKKKKLIPIS